MKMPYGMFIVRRTDMWKKIILAVLLLFPAVAAADMDIQIDLTWIPPTNNADGTVLTDLAGYTIHYGFASRAYSQVIEVNDNNATTFTFPLSGLTNGSEIFVAMKAFDETGNKSNFSNEVSFGPFLEVDSTAPAAPALQGTVTITVCPQGAACSAQ